MGYNTILIKGGRGHFSERVAASAITPGHLVAINSVGKVAVHGSEGGETPMLFAREDGLQGKTIADAYVADNQVFLYNALPGDVVYAWLKAGENVGLDSHLVSAGDGTLIEDTSVGTGVTVKRVVAIPLEAVNLSASGAVNTRIKVQIL